MSLKLILLDREEDNSDIAVYYEMRVALPS